MISRLSISGFRSLLSFSLDLKPGLNVFVGPNGSGKTNLIRFFDFLANLVSGGVPLAFDRAGGAVHVFCAEALKTTSNPRFSFQIEGVIAEFSLLEMPAFASRRDEPESGCDRYLYEGEIIYDRDLQGVYIASESVRLLRRDRTEEFSVHRKTTGRSGESKAFFNEITATTSKAGLVDYIRSPRYKTQDENFERRIGIELSPEQSILQSLEMSHSVFMRISQSLTSLSSINISPDAARSTTSVSDTSMIDQTGRGLTSVLSRLKLQQYYPFGLNFRVLRSMPSAEQQTVVFKSILNWVGEVNPDIEDINVWPDTFSATLRAEIRMKIDGKVQSFSFDKISDGTVKWIALVTTLFTAPHFGSIEEPENFLHPRMQDIFVQLVRERVTQSNRNMIVTTHSESLLNVCVPEELLVFRFGASGTQARRPANAAQLDEALKKGRFRLGHYYRTGAIDA